MNAPGFNESLKNKLVAAGFTALEIEHGALMAQMLAAVKLIGNPLAAMAVSQTFSKAMASLSEAHNTDAEKVTAASDIIFNEAMGKARQIMDAAKHNSGLDTSPAPAPKDIN